MIETTSEVEVAPSSLVSADPAWSCRWCASRHGVRVLDAGLQPPSDLHPQPSDPEPDPEYPLAMVMCNHGLLTCGATIQQAFNTMYQLEMSCRSQVDSMAARTELTMPGENVLAHTAHLYQPGTRRPYGVLEWPAMLRLLEAEGKSSGYPAYWN